MLTLGEGKDAMAGSGGASVATQEQGLRLLVDQLGFTAVAENLGVTDSGLQSLLDGDVEMDAAARDGFSRMCAVMGDAVGWWSLEDQVGSRNGRGSSLEADDDYGEEDSWYSEDRLALLPPEADRKPAEEWTALERQAAAPVRSAGWEDERERRRQVLWRALDLAIRRQFVMGLSYGEQIRSMLMVIRLELALIMNYNESVPDPGVRWDIERKHREIDRRLARQRWGEEQLRKSGGLLGGVVRWLRSEEVSGKELYLKMIAEADRSMTYPVGALPSGEVGPGEWIGDFGN